MSQIIVSPREQRAFANALCDISRDMISRERALTAKLNVLSTTWSDKHYKRFSQAQLTMELHLKAFHNRSQAYCIYLERKAKAGNAYLGL